MSRSLGPSASWNSQGLSRPVQGLLYLLYSLVHGEAFEKMDEVELHVKKDVKPV
jgi:hypothetical protein